MPSTQHDVDFHGEGQQEVRGQRRMGWGAFDYDAASDSFSPSTMASTPQQANDAKCGFACHTVVQNRDYVFTEYGKR